MKTALNSSFHAVSADSATEVTRFPALFSRCIALRRSSASRAVQDRREQVNILSAYIDASHVYGVNRRELASLRDFRSNLGLLRVRNVPLNSSMLSLLPPTTPDRFCLSTSPRANPCFLAGDFRRNNENQGETI